MIQIDLLKDWTAAQTVTLTAAVIAVIGVAATILTTSGRARREHRAGLYADALSAVGQYLDGPYRSAARTAPLPTATQSPPAYRT